MVHHPSIQRCPKPVALPIVFVPGIMGSRLKNGNGDTVWSPVDSMRNTVALALADARKKRRMLVGLNDAHGHDPDYLQVDYGNVEMFYSHINPGPGPRHLPPPPAAQEKFDRNWGGLILSFYGDFLSWLTETAPSGTTVQRPQQFTEVHYEVWAHPYNWTNDNLDSGGRLAETVQAAIDGTIQKYAGTDVQVLKPVLITHSMGGLVARAYMQLHGGAGAVHAVMHGAMPTDGAPTTYKRMLAGFEGTSRFVLGTNQVQVTATAGNMPGALQLLPNQRHKDVAGDTDWLRCIGRDGTQRWSKPSANPYSEIYLNQSDWWRLIYREYLNPAGNEDEAYEAYVLQLTKVSTFHARLGTDGFHPKTIMFYADDPDLLAWDKIEWKQTAHRDDPDPTSTVNNNNRGTFEWGEWLQSVHFFGPYQQGAQFVAQTRYEIQDKSAPGDGTVHAGSGRHERVESHAMQEGFEHDAAFDNTQARALVAEWLFDMLEEQVS